MKIYETDWSIVDFDKDLALPDGSIDYYDAYDEPNKPFLEERMYFKEITIEMIETMANPDYRKCYCTADGIRRVFILTWYSLVQIIKANPKYYRENGNNIQILFGKLKLKVIKGKLYDASL